MTTTEERMARVEGILEEVRQEIRDLHGDMRDLRGDIRNLVMLVVTLWITSIATTVLTVLFRT